MLDDKSGLASPLFCLMCMPMQRKFAVMAHRAVRRVVEKLFLERNSSTRYYEVREMSKRDSYEERTEALLVPVVAANDCEIYDVEYVKEGSDWYLRAYIDKPDGVGIQDCENVSRALSEKLDEEDFISDAYILEVSSPGLGRALKKDRHLEKSIGKEVEIKTYKPINKQKEFIGILKSYDKDTIIIKMGSASKTNDMVFARADIAIIRLTFDF